MTDTTDREASRDAYEDAIANGDHERAAEIAQEYAKRNRQPSY